MRGAPQFQPITRVRPSRAPAAVFGVRYVETFPTAGDLDSAAEDLTWTASNMSVSSGQATVTAPSLGEAQAEHNVSSLNMYVQVDFTACPTSGNVFLVGRASGALLAQDDGVYFYVQENGGATDVELGGWVPASGVIDSDSLASSPVATWRLELEGTTARGYRNGVLVVSGTCSATPDGLRAGFQLNEVGSTLDNFEYGDL